MAQLSLVERDKADPAGDSQNDGEGMEHRAFETGSHTNPSKRAAHCASLSVIIVSAGDRANLERALSAIAVRCRRLEAEIIVVRMNVGDELRTLNAAYPSVLFIDAPQASTSVDMRELGMAYADGDIVSLRNDDAVGDGLWLSVFDAMVGIIDEPTMSDAEVAMTPTSDDSIAAFEQARRQGWGYVGPNSSADRHAPRRDASFVVSSLHPVADTPASSQREI